MFFKYKQIVKYIKKYDFNLNLASRNHFISIIKSNNLILSISNLQSYLIFKILFLD